MICFFIWLRTDVKGTENWTDAYNELKYYNLDLKTGKFVTLKDILGSDYVELVNGSIEKQIAPGSSGEIEFEIGG